MRICCITLGALLLAATPLAHAEPEMLIESLDGPVTAKEVAAFKAYMATLPLPVDNNHNAMVYGSAGGAVESLGTVYEVTHDRAILDRMLEFTDAMLAGRNDPEKGRVLWTGKRDLVWPNKRADDAEAAYSGAENGDVVGHIGYAAFLILREPAIAKDKVGSGDPHHYGATYGERARHYVTELDRTMDSYLLPWLVDPKSLRYRSPISDLYAKLGPRYERSQGKGIPWNQQMMLNNGFQRLAECHALLHDDAARTAKYDAIVKASCDSFLRTVTKYRIGDHDCYKWSYATDDPTLHYMEDTGHGGYDVLVYRAYASGRYGITVDAMQPFANTVRYAIIRGPKQFAKRVDGSGAVTTELGSTWLYLAEFDPELYSLIASADLEHAKTKPDMTARILWWKNRKAAAAKTSTKQSDDR